MVDFTFTEEQEILRREVRKWCSKELTLEKVREMDKNGEIPREVIKGMADLGLLLMTVPEEHGGAGADWVTACIIAEELGYADISMAVPVFFLVQASWGYVTDKYCTEQIREEFIQRAIKGEAFIGIAVTEAGGGSDVASIKSTGMRDGDYWLLNGEKLYISGTEEARKMGGGHFTLVRTSPPQPGAAHRGLTAFFVPMNAPGVEIEKKFEDMGRMAISTGGFIMNNVKLSDAYRIGDEGRGFYLAMEGFDNARLLIGAACVGAAQRALELGMEWIKERKAFGQPIGKYEGIQFELADLWARLEAVRSLVYRAAWMNNEKYKRGRFTPLEVTKYIAAIKLLAPKLTFRIFEHVILWMGAWGYTKECPLEMGLRGVMSYYLGAEGTPNIMKIIIGRELLGKEFVPYR